MAGLLPDFGAIRAGNQAQREERRKARENKNLASDVRKTLAATKPKPKREKSISDVPSHYEKPGNRPRPAPAKPSGGGSAVAMPTRTPGGGASIPGQARSGLGAAPAAGPTGAQLTPSIPPAAPSTPLPKPSPAVAKGYRAGLKTGAAKVAAKPSKSEFKPEPSQKTKLTGLGKLLAGNKGNNERLALERMKKASRKG